MNKSKQGLEAVIDWVQVTFKELNHFEIMDYILQFDSELMTHENRGRFRYAGKWCFGGIEILTPPDDYPEMGYHIYMTGSACRSFEIYLKAQNRTWYDFFKDCLKYGGRFTRLDIAIDDRKPYLNIRKLNKKIKQGECVSKFRNRVLIDSGTTMGKYTGCTVNLGSGESLCCMVFYEKNYEQSKKTGLPIETYGIWNRYEVRLKQEMATNCIKKLVERNNICFIGLEIINYYIRITVKKPTDDNRSRWTLWKPWEQFMEGMDQLKLSMRPAPRTLEQKKQWITNYVAPTLKMIQIADDNLGEEFLKNLLEETTLKKNQKKIVEDYLFSREVMQDNII
jgi:phage replication initiation protein